MSLSYARLVIRIFWHFFQTGALDPRCKVCIFMGKTDTSAAKHRQQSMILVPMDTPGIRIVRPLTVFGYDDAPGKIKMCDCFILSIIKKTQ